MDDPVTGRRFITVREFAARQGLTDGAIRAWVRAHDLPHIRLGKRILIPEDALETMLARQREG